MINEPIFCITADCDWASDYCIEDFTSLVSGYGIKPTIFATHESAAIKKLLSSNNIEVGLHPNFLPGSSQGTDYSEIVDNLFKIYPEAKTFRAHSYFDNSRILQYMLEKGVRYDSNISLYLQPNITPLRLAVGVIRFPVFWDDDGHWINSNNNWNPDYYLQHFLSPGLKILNFHPFFVTGNIPDEKYYSKMRDHIQTMDSDSVNSLRYSGEGPRTFLTGILDKLTSLNERFHTLDELYHLFPAESALVQKNEKKGRTSIHTDDEYNKYWQMEDKEKQAFLKETFQTRNARDKYATSQDFNIRELEIDSIKKSINTNEKGTIIDLGCGNGYTLLSLAKELEGWKMIGIDFSDNLIDGANYLKKEAENELKSDLQFINTDAIEYIKNCESDSIQYMITERFIQNMPSEDVQMQVIKEAYRILSSKGKLLMCEGSADGFNALNNLRKSVGLTRIPDSSKDNVSAIRMNDGKFESCTEKDIGFKLKNKLGYSNFFIISRVLHPLMCAPLSPRFDSKINMFARQIQENSPYEAGYGGNVLWVFEK